MKVKDQQCNHELHIKANQFFHPDLGFMAGLVCKPCNTLYDWPAHSFIKAVKEVSGGAW